MKRRGAQLLITQLFLFITVVILCLTHIHIARADGPLGKALYQCQVVPEYR